LGSARRGEGDLPQALEAFRDAAEIASALGDPALLVGVGDGALKAGDAPMAIETLDAAVAVLRAAGNIRETGRAFVLLGKAQWENGASDRASEALWEAVRLLEPMGPSAELVQALTWSSNLHMLAGRAAEGIAVARAGLPMAESLGLDGAVGHLLNTIGSCQVTMGDGDGLSMLQHALERSLESGDVEALGRAYTNLSEAQILFLRLPEGLETCHQGRDAMRRLGAPQWEWYIASNEVWVLAWLGRLDEGEALAREILDTQPGVVGVPGCINTGTALAWMLLCRGDCDGARRFVDDAGGPARDLGDPEQLSVLLAVVAELEEACGNLEAARRAAATAVEVALATASLSFGAYVVVPAVRLLGAAGAGPILDRLRSLDDQPSFRAKLTEADALLSGDAALFARAADIYSSLGAALDEARCRLEAGDLERADELIVRCGVERGPLGARLAELAGR
jgi:tetratricopeptide (TPR) repeat protein